MNSEIPEPIRKECETKGGVKGIKQKIPSNKEIKSQSQVFHALSDPLRLKIMLLVVEQPLCVCLIKDILGKGISDSKLSYHINILKDTGLITGNKQAKWIIYSPTKLGEEAVMVARKL